ncbi:MAG: hypothetical protein ACJAZ1_001801 [Yoonia sp.]|jgi:hypothetical protein
MSLCCHASSDFGCSLVFFSGQDGAPLEITVKPKNPDAYAAIGLSPKWQHFVLPFGSVLLCR